MRNMHENETGFIFNIHVQHVPELSLKIVHTPYMYMYTVMTVSRTTSLTIMTMLTCN